MPGDVIIIEMDRGFSVVSWLCPKHIAARKRKGWDEKWRKPPPHELACEDCPRKERR